jgi:hypothetical protein
MGKTRNRPSDRPPSAAKSEQFRQTYPRTFNAAARWSFSRTFAPGADRDGYPSGYWRWARDKRRAWLAGASLGFRERLFWAEKASQ